MPAELIAHREMVASSVRTKPSKELGRSYCCFLELQCKWNKVTKSDLKGQNCQRGGYKPCPNCLTHFKQTEVTSCKA